LHISDEAKEQIKQANDIVEVIGSYVQLTKDGTLYKGSCPFHKEKTPSFKVYPESQSYYCYGCKSSGGGDVIVFIRNIENIGFVDACKLLADRAGIQLAETEEERSLNAEKEMLTKRNRRYYKALRESPRALNYLYDRGITDETMAKYRLGYVSLSEYPENIRDHISFAIMETCHRPEKAHTISMAYRTLNDGDPKYRNEPNSNIYKKGNMLYLLSHAVKAIRTKKYAIVVEGYMDALRLHQDGLENTVATMGTAFTTEQMKLLRQYADTIYLWYDNDESGQSAMIDVLPELLRIGFTVYFTYSDGDPDEVAARVGADNIEKYIMENSRPAMFSILDEACSRYDVVVLEAKKEALKRILPLLEAVQNPADRMVYRNTVMQRLGLKTLD